jgi:hypothetical protein
MTDWLKTALDVIGMASSAAKGVGDKDYNRKEREYFDNQQRDGFNRLLNIAANTEPNTPEYEVVIDQIMSHPLLPENFRQQIKQVQDQRRSGMFQTTTIPPATVSIPTSNPAIPTTNINPNTPTTKGSFWDFVPEGKKLDKETAQAIEAAFKADPKAPAPSSWDAALAVGQQGVGYADPVVNQFPNGVQLPADVRRSGGTVVEQPGTVLPADANRNGGTATVGTGWSATGGPAPSGTKYPGYGPAGQEGGIVGVFPKTGQAGGITSTGDPAVDAFLRTREGQAMVQAAYPTGRALDEKMMVQGRERLAAMLSQQTGGTGGGVSGGGTGGNTGGNTGGGNVGVWDYPTAWNFGAQNSQRKAMAELALAKANMANAKTPYEVQALQEKVNNLIALTEANNKLAYVRQTQGDKNLATTQPAADLLTEKGNTEKSKQGNLDASAYRNTAQGDKAYSDAQVNVDKAQAKVNLDNAYAELARAKTLVVPNQDKRQQAASDAKIRQIETVIKINQAKLNATDGGTVKAITDLERALKATEDVMRGVSSIDKPKEYAILQKTYDELMGQLDKKVSGVKTPETSIPAPASPGQAIDDATAEKILNEVGGDPEKARQKAREMGYTF